MPHISKQHLIYGGVAFLIIVAALAVFFLSPKLPFNKETPVVEHTEPVIRTETVAEKTDAYTIDMKYPQFDIPVIDAKIKAGVDEFVADFKKEAAEKRAGEAPYELMSSYAGTYLDDEVVSTRLTVSRFTGGAHPGTMIYGLNYAKETGKEIGLASVLKLIGATLEQVADASTAELEKKLGDSFIRKGAEASSDNYWMYSINDKGVTFIFNEYQVAPYAAGPQRVSFARAAPPSAE